VRPAEAIARVSCSTLKVTTLNWQATIPVELGPHVLEAIRAGSRNAGSLLGKPLAFKSSLIALTHHIFLGGYLGGYSGRTLFLQKLGTLRLQNLEASETWAFSPLELNRAATARGASIITMPGRYWRQTNGAGGCPRSIRANNRTTLRHAT
jgi:hypothetical protein